MTPAIAFCPTRITPSGKPAPVCLGCERRGASGPPIKPAARWDDEARAWRCVELVEAGSTDRSLNSPKGA